MPQELRTDRVGHSGLLRRAAAGTHVEDVGARQPAGRLLPVVAFRCKGVQLLEAGQLLRTEDRSQFLAAPGVEFAFLPLAVGILGGGETALGCDHVPQHVGQNLPRRAGVELLAGRLVGLRVGQSKHGLVVEHLLEMRHPPEGIGGVAMKAVTHVIEDASPAHLRQGLFDHLQSPILPVSMPVAQQEEEVVGAWEFRRLGETAVALVELAGQALVGQPENGLIQRRPAAAGLGGFVQSLEDRLARRADLLPAGGPNLGDLGDQLQHAGPPVAAFPGNVGRGEEGFLVRAHDDRQGPSAPAGEQLGHGHVQLIDVGTFLPVHLDVDEGVVHQTGDLLILEALPFHHVAPVAGGVADGEEDRSVLLCRLTEGFLSPRIPVHGVRRVLQQIGAVLVLQSIHDRLLLLAAFRPGRARPGRARPG